MSPRRATRKPARVHPQRRRKKAARAAVPLAYNVRVGDVLSRPVVLVGAEATLFDALTLMRTHNISGLPVIDASRAVVGVISEKDLARLAFGVADFPEIKGVLDVLMIGLADQPSEVLWKVRRVLETTPVNDAMSSPPMVIRSDAPLELAAEVMREEGINRLPVVDDQCLVGIVTRNDLVRALIPAGAHAR